MKRQIDPKKKIFKQIAICLNMYIFVLFFCLGSVCCIVFFYKFNYTDPGLQLGDPAPLIGLLLWTF